MGAAHRYFWDLVPGRKENHTWALGWLLHYQWPYAWPRASTTYRGYFPTPCSWKLPGSIFFKNKWWLLLKGPFLLIFRQPTQTARSLASAWAASVTDSIRQQQVYLNWAKPGRNKKKNKPLAWHHYNRIRWGKTGGGQGGSTGAEYPSFAAGSRSSTRLTGRGGQKTMLPIS